MEGMAPKNLLINKSTVSTLAMIRDRMSQVISMCDRDRKLAALYCKYVHKCLHSIIHCGYTD